MNSKNNEQKNAINNQTGAINLEYGDGTNISTTTTTGSFFINQYERKLENVDFIENEEGNFIEITYSLNPTYQIYYSNGTTPQRSMIKERYGAVDGKMQLIKSISGLEVPGHYVPASIEWEE